MNSWRLSNSSFAPSINGSGKEIKFPLTLALSPIGGEGIKMEPFSSFH